MIAIEIRSLASADLASLFSVKRKKSIINTPKMTRLMTFGLLQVKIAPPKSRPRIKMSATARTENVPNQSITSRPSRQLALAFVHIQAKK